MTLKTKRRTMIAVGFVLIVAQLWSLSILHHDLPIIGILCLIGLSLSVGVNIACEGLARD